MIKQLILLVILIGSLLLVSEIEQTTIQVVIVIPLELVPYVDWWLSFPGWQQPQNPLPNPQDSKFGFLETLNNASILSVC